VTELTGARTGDGSQKFVGTAEELTGSVLREPHVNELPCVRFADPGTAKISVDRELLSGLGSGGVKSQLGVGKQEDYRGNVDSGDAVLDTRGVAPDVVRDARKVDSLPEAIGPGDVETVRVPRITLYLGENLVPRLADRVDSIATRHLKIGVWIGRNRTVAGVRTRGIVREHHSALLAGPLLTFRKN